MNKYCVLILSNSGKSYDSLLTSLLKAQPDLNTDQIYVVDSGIDSSTKAKWKVHYILGDINQSFAKSLNSGIKATPKDADLFFVIDQGLMLTKNGIDDLRSSCYSASNIGMAGTALVGKGTSSYNTFQSIGELYKPTRRSEIEKKDTYNPSLILLAVYFKREFLDKVAPIPENIFTYGYEDQYFSDKALQLSYDWIINPDVIMNFPEWEGYFAASTYFKGNLARNGKEPNILNAYYYHEAEELTPDQKKLSLHVQNSVMNAIKGISKVPPEVLEIHGMSSSIGRHLFNNICSFPKTSYLEIGTWKGSTLISALINNKQTLVNAVAIDNWSRCGGPEKEFHENIERFLKGYPLQFYCEDCFSVDLKKVVKTPINIYFYDGEHSHKSQSDAFTYYNSIFTDTFIALVDDWNSDGVRSGTWEAFETLKYKVLYEIVLPSRWNGDQESWWDGYYIALVQKS